MVKIYEDIKTIIVVGDETNESIYNYCNEWLGEERISYTNFISIEENSNLKIMDNWKIFFRKELETKNVKSCDTCEYKVSMLGTSLGKTHIYCNYERIHIPIITGFKCNYFKEQK